MDRLNGREAFGRSLSRLLIGGGQNDCRSWMPENEHLAAKPVRTRADGAENQS